jgi:hexokinase
VYRQEAYFEQLEPGTQCKPKSLFSAELPVTHVLTNMALEAEAKRMVAQFEYTAEDVNKGVKEFIREMEEGLDKEGAMLSQIPTYVTSVPNGTEKVGHQAHWGFN